MRLKRLLLGFLIICSAAANAEGIPLFYWDNQKNFVEANHCQISPVEKSHFRFSHYFGQEESQTENLRNFNGIRQSHLANYSLVKLMQAKRKKNYEYVEAVGINNLKGLTHSRWFTKRGDQGYLYHRALLPPEDYIMLLGKESPRTPLGKLRNNPINTMWHIAFEDNYFKMSCPENDSTRDYIVFRVYTPSDREGAIALVGVYWGETEILRSFESLTKARAHKFIPSILDEDHMDQLIPSSQMGKEIVGLNEHITEEEIPQLVLPQAPTTSHENTVLDSMDHVICLPVGNSLNVRNDQLEKVVFQATPGESVKVFQGWGSNPQEITLNGIDHSFVKVQFPNREARDQDTGWVSSFYVQPQSKCKHVEIKLPFTEEKQSKNITGLNDPRCCEFPTVKRPTHSYQKGMRKFGAGRAEGKRKHAGCDLYRYKNEPVLAVAPGKVVRGRYFFYQGTYAIEVLHTGGFVARYGEMTGKDPGNIKKGASVKMGDQVGYIGKVNSNCCRPMLHLELYKGDKKGPLTQPGTIFKRRTDLLNPTKYLMRWENDKF